MAQLKDLLVTGASRFIGNLFANEAQITTLNAPTSAGDTTYGPGTNGQVLRSNASSVYWASLGDAADKVVTDRSSATALSNSGTGLVTERAVYYGLPTINNAHNYTSSTTIYAPTAGGTANTQALVGNGATTAPKWVNISPSISITAGTSSATPKVNVTVLGQSGTAQSLTTASTSVYGATKLTDAYTSTDATLAATGKSILAAIQTLNVSSVGGGTGEYISTISETNGKISATKTTTTVSNTWTAGTTAGPTIKTTVNGVDGTAVAIPSAASGASGVVTTGAQQFDGNKTFNGHIYTKTDNTYDIGANATRFKNGYFISGRFGDADAAGGGVYLYTESAQYGRFFTYKVGTESEDGISDLTVGNGTPSGTAKNARGRITIYGKDAAAHQIYSALTDSTHRTVYLQNYEGTQYLVHAGSSSAVGSDSQPVYVAANGRITAITGDIDNNAATATGANITTTANAVAYYTNTTGTFGSKASANGALYATAANGTLSWGTLPVAQGGTGATSFTANSVIISGSTTTAALTTRSLRAQLSAATAPSNDTSILTQNALYYYKGNTNLTNVGTISSGTWQGTAVGLAYGGTGATSAADATKNLIGTTAIGNTVNPVYWSGTAFTACDDSISIFYGACSTAAATQQKAVTITNFPTTLTAGLSVRIKFTNAQSYNGQPTLKINSLDAKNIVLYGTTAGVRYMWRAGEVMDFLYDGTNFVAVNFNTATTSYYGLTKLTDSITSTSTTTAATPNSVKQVNDRLTYGTTDLTAGTSALTTGVLYFVYE